MINYVKGLNYSKLIILIFTLAFTFIIRAHGYERVPTPNHLDEMLYAWSGIYLIETGAPVSWSTLDYPKRAEIFKGIISYRGGLPEASVTLYKPWLDEPPLFSILVGYFAHINGADRNQFIPSSYIRIPLVFIGLFTSVVIFLVAQKLFDFKTGILSVITYSLTPVFLFGSRTALPENLIALIFMIILYLLLLYKKKLKYHYLIPIPVLVGIAGLSKPTGFFLILFSVFTLMWFSFNKIHILKLVKRLLFMILGLIPFIAYYFWYNYTLDYEIFKTIFSIQSGRPVGFSNFANILIDPSFAMSPIRDGWYMFSFVYALYLIIKPKKSFKIKYIAFAFVFWMLVVMFTGGEGDPMSWYRYPSFPVLAIISAVGLINLYKVNNIFSTFVFFGLLLTSRYLMTTPFNFNVNAINYKMWFILALTPGLLQMIFKKDIWGQLNKFSALAIIISGLFLNTSLIYRYYDLHCEAKTCPMVPSTKLSQLRFPFDYKFLMFKFKK